MIDPNIRDGPVDIVPADHAQASILATLIRQSYADVARRFGITPQNGATHPSWCTEEWIRADLRIGVRYYLAAWYHRQGFRDVGQRRYDHLPFGVRFMRLNLDALKNDFDPRSSQAHCTSG